MTALLTGARWPPVVLWICVRLMAGDVERLLGTPWPFEHLLWGRVCLFGSFARL